MAATTIPETIPKPKNPLEENRLITKGELAFILRVSTRTLEGWMKSGELEFIRLGKKAIRFSPYYIKKKYGV